MIGLKIQTDSGTEGIVLDKIRTVMPEEIHGQDEWFAVDVYLCVNEKSEFFCVRPDNLKAVLSPLPDISPAGRVA